MQIIFFTQIVELSLLDLLYFLSLVSPLKFFKKYRAFSYSSKIFCQSIYFPIFVTLFCNYAFHFLSLISYIFNDSKNHELLFKFCLLLSIQFFELFNYELFLLYHYSSLYLASTKNFKTPINLNKY